MMLDKRALERLLSLDDAALTAVIKQLAVIFTISLSPLNLKMLPLLMRKKLLSTTQALL